MQPRSDRAGPSPEWVSPDSRQGWLLNVWVQPGAKFDEVVGVMDGSLKVRLSAPAVDNKANNALIGYVAKRLSLPRRHVTLAGGSTGRRKRILVTAEAEPAWDELARAGR